MLRELLAEVRSVEGISLEKFCVTMCNVAISMRKSPDGSGEAAATPRRWRNLAIVVPSTTVRPTDAFPASLQKVSSCQPVRGMSWNFLEGRFIHSILLEIYLLLKNMSVCGSMSPSSSLVSFPVPRNVARIKSEHHGLCKSQ